ncbi:MAG: HPF/RaiA family ribosome-associated protein [Desulfohalobiaceae bacterium]|nr:HPF/RaiA family ribosome-associated protein [Desulfohalobiaceae bacterium]
MQIPMEISYKHVSKSDWIDDFINKQAEKLERYTKDIISCRVAVEMDHKSRTRGNPFYVRVEVSLPGKKRLVTSSEPLKAGEDTQQELRNVIRDAFRSMEKRLKKTQAERKHQVKARQEQPHALVVRLFPEMGYGFLKQPDTEEEIYFHRNSVPHGDFERMAVGTEVRYEPEMGEEGLQASSVHIVSKPGKRERPEEPSQEDVPSGWS